MKSDVLVYCYRLNRSRLQKAGNQSGPPNSTRQVADAVGYTGDGGIGSYWNDVVGPGCGALLSGG